MAVDIVAITRLWMVCRKLSKRCFRKPGICTGLKVSQYQRDRFDNRSRMKLHNAWVSVYFCLERRECCDTVFSGRAGTLIPKRLIAIGEPTKHPDMPEQVTQHDHNRPPLAVKVLVRAFCPPTPKPALQYSLAIPMARWWTHKGFFERLV